MRRPLKSLTFRIPEDLHAAIVERAKLSKRSLNSELCWLAENGLRNEDVREVVRAEMRRGFASVSMDEAEPIGSPPPAYAQ